MTLSSKDTGGGDFKKVPEGTYSAVCDMLVDMGYQVTEYMGEKSLKMQVYIRWQIPSERITFKDADGNEKEGPMVIGKVYTNSLSEKANLRKDLQGWRGKAFTKDELNGFDLQNIVGKCCQIVVTHREARNGNTYANVTTVAGWPKGMDPIEAENETLVFSAEDDVGDVEALPKWLKEKVTNQATGQELYEEQVQQTAERSRDDYDDDIPF